MHKVLYERSCSMLLSWSTLKRLLWKGVADEFCQYLEPFAIIIIIIIIIIALFSVDFYITITI